MWLRYCETFRATTAVAVPLSRRQSFARDLKAAPVKCGKSAHLILYEFVLHFVAEKLYCDWLTASEPVSQAAVISLS